MTSSPNNQVQTEPAHQSIMDACKSGDLEKLQQLFRDANVKEGDNPVLPHPQPDGATSPAPVTVDLLTTAVAHRHPHIVAFLLSTYPKVRVDYESVLQAAFQNPHLDTFKLLHAHQPGIVLHEFDPWRNALSEACDGGKSDPTIPDYLIDHGAAESEAAGGPRGTPLGAAILSGQPLQLIQKMISNGVPLGHLHVSLCLTAKRADVLQFLLESPSLSLSTDEVQQDLARSKEIGDANLVSVIENYIQNTRSDGGSRSNGIWNFLKRST
ncbi:hypothetical protein SLS57_007031 [Botryosphaeria dothidea]